MSKFVNHIRSARERLGGNSEFRRILSNIGWLSIDKVFRMSVGLLTSVWIARFLGPDQFGSLSFSIAFTAIFGSLANLGIDSLVVRELIQDSEQQHSILGSAFCIRLGGAIAGIVSAICVILLMQPGNPQMLYLVGIASATLIFQSFGVIESYFQSQVKSKYVVYANNTAFFLASLLKLGLILGNGTLLEFAVVSSLELLFSAIFLIWVYRANQQEIVNWRFDRIVATKMLKDGLPLLLAGMATILYMRVDIIMLQQLTDSTEVGIYCAATRISEIWYFIPMVIVASISPALIRNSVENPKNFIHKLRLIYFGLIWMAIIIAAVLSIFSKPLIALLYGGGYPDAAAVLLVHLWANIPVFVGVASSQYLLAMNYQTIALKRAIIGLLVNVALNFWLIPLYGAVGAAVSTLVSYFVSVYSLLIFRPTRSQGWLILRAPFLLRW